MSEKKKTGAEVVADFSERISALETYKAKQEENRSRGLGMNGEAAQEFSFQRALAGIASNDWEGREFERDELLRGKQMQRDLGFVTTTAGGFVVPPEYINSLIEMLRAKTVCLESGATQMMGLTGSPVQIPKQASAGTAYWRAENTALTESDQVFAQVTLTPKTLTGLTTMSNEVLMLSNPSIEQIVRNDLAAVLARALDLAALEGAGSGPTEPITGVASVGTDVGIDGAVDYDSLLDMIYALEAADADMGSLGWVMHPRTLSQLRKVKDSTGQYMLQPSVASGLPATLWGAPVRSSTQISITQGAGTDSYAVYANWADMLWATWGSLELMASNQAGDYFANNQTGIRAVLYTDIGFRHDESFVVGTGITA